MEAQPRVLTGGSSWGVPKRHWYATTYSSAPYDAPFADSLRKLLRDNFFLWKSEWSLTVSIRTIIHHPTLLQPTTIGDHLPSAAAVSTVTYSLRMSKKRRHDQVEADAVPTQDDVQQLSSAPKPVKSKGQSRQEKSERRSKKQKREKKQKDKTAQDTKSSLIDENGTEIPEVQDQASPAVQESKEERKLAKKLKREKKQKESIAQDAKSSPIDEIHEVQDQASPAIQESKDEVKAAKKQKKRDSKDESNDQSNSEKTPARFIVFVGNLPYTATAAQVQDHFVKLGPADVRLTTDKATGQGKGFAFVEFDGYDKMKTCLKLYHHSIFDPESKGKDKENTKEHEETGEGKKRGRRINVELTAGGGGKKSKGRKERIKSKNEKLDQERERTKLKEKAEQEEAQRNKKDEPQTGANTAQKSNGSIHPSRLAQMRH